MARGRTFAGFQDRQAETGDTCGHASTAKPWVSQRLGRPLSGMHAYHSFRFLFLFFVKKRKYDPFSPTEFFPGRSAVSFSGITTRTAPGRRLSLVQYSSRKSGMNKARICRLFVTKSVCGKA